MAETKDTPTVDEAGLPHEEYLLATNAKNYLKKLGIIDVAEEHLPQEPLEKIYQFLGPRIFDRGMRQALPFPIIPQSVPPEHIPEDFDHIRNPLLVLSSSMLPILLENEYKIVTKFDVANVSGANQAGNIFGDYLLRDVCNNIIKKLKNSTMQLIRLGGDEFAVVEKNISAADPATLETSLVGEAQKVKGLFQKEEGETMVTDFSAAAITFDGSALRPALHHLEPQKKTVLLQSRINQLVKTHKELQAAFEGENQLPLDSENTGRFVTLIEHILYDPLIRAELENYKDLRVPLVAYKDRTDFIQHLQESGETFQFFRISTPGVLKRVNTDATDSYTSGDVFIRQEFRDIMDAIIKRVPPDQIPSITVHMLRSGSDFFIAANIPEAQAKEWVAAIETGNQAKMKHFTAQTAKKNTAYPIFRNASFVPVTLTKAEVNNYQALEENQMQVFKAFETTEKKVWERQDAQMKNYFDANPPDGDWHFLAEFYNPYHKRGILHLARKRVPRDTINRLKPLYSQIEKLPWKFDEGKLEAFKALSKEIL